LQIKKYIKKVFKITPFSWPAIAFREIVKHEKQRAGKRLRSNDYIQSVRVQSWFKDKGDETLRLNYDLTENSVVFDLGGYKGEFASAIMNKYNCTVFIFEPIPFLYDIIVNKFSNNSKLHPYCFGLYDKTIRQQISLSDNASSIFISKTNTHEIQLKDIAEFLHENNVGIIDLIKINIEGAEYDLLESLINQDLISGFKNIQVQFHDFILPNAELRMRNIQQQLSKTHQLTYQYEFVWENWKIKEN
jgi:FkbM family methyltransferase